LKEGVAKKEESLSWPVGVFFLAEAEEVEETEAERSLPLVERDSLVLEGLEAETEKSLEEEDAVALGFRDSRISGEDEPLRVRSIEVASAVADDVEDGWVWFDEEEGAESREAEEEEGVFLRSEEEEDGAGPSLFFRKNEAMDFVENSG
jgi:hypothetical protein